MRRESGVRDIEREREKGGVRERKLEVYLGF